MLSEKLLIGSEEWCALPDLGISAIRARIDSGAKTSSIHAFNIQPFRRSKELWVSFEVHPVQKNRRIVVRCEAPVIDRRQVKSSSGESQYRYVIQSLLHIGNMSWTIEVTLANRDSMGFRMLLGREAMSGRTIVDPGGNLLLGHPTNEELMRLYATEGSQKSGLKIGVLASDPELYSNRRLIEAGEERGHEMVFLNIKHCYIKIDSHEPEVHYRGGKVLKDFNALIPRIRPSITFYGCSLVRQFESMKVAVLNSSLAIAQSRDKLYSLQALLANGVEIPITGFAHSPLETEDLINMVGGAPLIIKLLEGTQGRGVVLAETRKAGESVINAFKSLKANILVQEFIKEANGTDLRCFVVDGKVVASMQRTAPPGEFRANIHRGGVASHVKITMEERKLAIRAAKTLNLDVAGVDIIRSERGPLLLEVNSSPGLEGIEDASGKDVARMMIQAVEKKLGWKRELADPVPPEKQVLS